MENFDLMQLIENAELLKKDGKNMPLYFAKTFGSESGAKVLSYLSNITLNRYLSQNATDAELRYLEGQRYLVSFIQNMVKKGQKKI